MFKEWCEKRKEANRKIVEEAKAKAFELSKKHREKCVAKIGDAVKEMVNKLCPMSSDLCSIACVHYSPGRADKPGIFLSPFRGDIYVCGDGGWVPCLGSPILPGCKLWGKSKE